MTDLGTLGTTNSTGLTNNSQGQVVGTSRVNQTTVHAFLWEKGGPMVDLNDLVSPKSDVVLDSPNAIADNGEIAVNGLPVGCDNVDVCGHPYVLIPDGDADDDVEARIAASQLRAATAQNASSIKYGSATSLSQIEQSGTTRRRLYRVPGQASPLRLPGQPVAPRD